jgi:hypothetical protein
MYKKSPNMSKELINLESIDWLDIAPNVIKIPAKVYKYRAIIKHYLKKAKVYVNKGATEVVILGRENVGKTVFFDGLRKESGSFHYTLPKASKNVESDVITFEKDSKIVRVIPPQVSSERFIGLDSSINNNSQLEGVIYMTDWGFTDVRDETRKKILIEEKKKSTLEEIRAFNLEEELTDFEKVCDRLREVYLAKKVSPKWLLILTNKVDLFYSQLNEAQKHYHLEYTSAFTDIAKGLIHDIGAKNIKYTCLPICSYEQDFIWNQTTIKTNLGGTDIKHAFYRAIISTISNF